MAYLRSPLALVLVLTGSLVACGDKVIPAGGDTDSGTDSGGGTDSMVPTCDDPAKCGPMPGAPSERCADGSTGGFTGRCIATGAATCGWEYRACPDLTCDGASGKTCASGSYCHHENGACGAGAGVCEPKPVGCGKSYQPMCGCDGVTYGNPCLAASSGVSVLYAGPCLLTGKSCGGFAGATCTPDEYCDYPGGAMCGATDASGICSARPSVCDTTYAPVCGCDGHTYSNACTAHGAGTDDATKGPCSK